MRQARVSHLVGGLKLHSTPSQNSPVLDMAEPGDVVDVSGETQAGRWTLVTYKGQLGYMWSSYLIEEKLTPGPAVPEPHEIDWLPEPAGPPAWMYIAGAFTIVIGFILAVAIVLGRG